MDKDDENVSSWLFVAICDTEVERRDKTLKVLTGADEKRRKAAHNIRSRSISFLKSLVRTYLGENED